MSSQTDILLNMPGPGGAEPIIALVPEPQATGPSSQIDPTLPVYGNPTTQSVRQNFATAQVEITGLMQQTVGAPFLPLSGAKMAGPMYLFNDPTDVMMPVTLGYFQTHGGGEGGGGGIPEAPSDGMFYLRSQGAWVPGVALQGGTNAQMTGELLLAGNPADALGAVPKQYADAIATTANAAVKRAGDIMIGLLTLSGDPTAPLGAVTKQYADNGLALKAPINNPTFTGTVNTAGRIIASAASGPALTLYDTTTGAPCLGMYNSGGYLSWGLMTAANGNPNGAPFATCDQSGNFLFATRVNVTGGRLITSSGTTSPSITLNNTTQSHIFGMWAPSASNILQFGLMDATGAPQNGVMNMDASGNLTTAGWVTVSQGVFINGPGSGNSLTVSAGAISIAGPASFASAITCSQTVTSTGYQFTANTAGFYPSSTGWVLRCGPTSYILGVQASADPAWTFNHPNGTQLCTHYSTGNMTISGTLSQGCDRNLKTDITELEKGIGLVRQLVPKSYKRKPQDDDIERGEPEEEWGFIAQDVQPVIPQAVGEAPPGGEGGQSYLTLNINVILAAVTYALQQVDRRLSAVETATKITPPEAEIA